MKMRWLWITAGMVWSGCGPEDRASSSAELAAQASPPLTLGLEVSALVPGETWTLTATGATPGASVWFVRGPAEGDGPCPGRLNGCLDVVSPTVMATAVADAAGVAVVSGLVPETASLGASHVFQAASPPLGDTSAVMAGSVTIAPPRPDFLLSDVNTTSPRSGESVSPRDYLEAVSGWYFGHST